MKRLFVLAGLLLAMSLASQEQDSLDWDIDSVFDEPSPEIPAEDTNSGKATVTARDLVQQRGFHVNASYRFNTGVAPGWYELPGTSGWAGEDYYLDRFVKMRSSLSIDAQISGDFRTKSTVYFEIPDFSFILGDFFFDYKLYDTVFFRGGKYNHSWGISPNYDFTNLLSRVPREGHSGDSFIFKADVPVGNGGFQALAMTRMDLMHKAVLPKLEDFGYGGKYNLAVRQADLDLGIFYQSGMALRTFLSVKTTAGATELYNEWLLAVDVDEPSNISGAFNVGFARDFFGGKFHVNGELFYNAERDTYWYQPETNVREAGTSPFIEGFNIALNLQYKLWEKGNPRLFVRTLYAPQQRSAQLVPGFRLSPWPHIELYFAVPASLGSKDGYYYENTVTKATENNDKALPFALIFMVTLSGSVQFGHYY